MPRPKAERPTYSLARRRGRYYVQWWECGAAQRISCRTQHLAEAKRFLAEFKVGRTAKVLPPSPTISTILDGYLEARRKHTHSATIEYDCRTLKRHLGNLPVDLLGEKQVEGYIIARRKEGARGAPAIHCKTLRPLSDGTLIRELGSLRSSLTWAVRQKWISTAPHVPRPQAPAARDRWLTRKEATALLSATRAPHVRLFVLLALHTAARTGALLSLSWEQVDLNGGLIYLGRARGKKRRATVPITDVLRHALEEAAQGATSEWVIEHAGHAVRSIKSGFRAAVRRAGLEGVTPHILRHTAATWMVQSDVPLPLVAAYLGNSVEMVERVYGHHSPSYLRKAAEALSRQLA